MIPQWAESPPLLRGEEAYQEAERRIAAALKNHAAELDLGNLVVEEYPPLLAQVSWLRALRLGDADFNRGEFWGRFPEGTVSSMPRLETLSCRGVRMQTLEWAPGLDALSWLNCSGTQVSDLAPLAKLKNLTSLHCSGTQVSDLAPLAKLKNLTSLHCSATQVSDLAPLAKLASLTSLNCSATQVTDLAPLANLSTLTSLDCSSTQVSDLAPLRPLVGRLVHLQIVRVPVPNVPAEVLSSGYDNCATRLLHYFADVDAGGRTNDRCKVLLVGDGYVGKTTLLGGLKTRQPQRHKPARTRGLLIEELPLGLPNGETVRVQLWDFGGQATYHATHRLFLQPSALFLLLWAQQYDAPPEDRHAIDYWMTLIKDRASEARVVLVESQIDRAERDNQAKAPTALSFAAQTHVSAWTGDGIEGLLGTLAGQVSEVRHQWGFVLPRSWIEVRDELASLKEGATADRSTEPSWQEMSIPRGQFEQMCVAAGVSDPATLLDYLHRAGEVLYFAGLFEDRVILDVGWLLTQAYALHRYLQDSAVPSERQGNFTGETLYRCWGSDEGVAKLFTSYLLSAKVAFEIARDHETPFQQRQFVLPSLLPPTREGISALRPWANVRAGECAVKLLGGVHRICIEQALVDLHEQYAPEAGWWQHGIALYDPQTDTEALLEYLPPRPSARGGPESCTRNASLRVRLRGVRAKPFLAQLLSYLEKTWPALRDAERHLSVDGLNFVRQADVETSRRVGGQHAPIVDGPQEGTNTPIDAFLTLTQLPAEETAVVQQQSPDDPVRVFISYSHKDEALKNDLETRLRALRGEAAQLTEWSECVSVWDDRQIPPGADWEQTIEKHLSIADVVCFLISEDFLASRFCVFKELQVVVERASNTDAPVIVPIIVRPTDWQNHALLRATQAIPTDGKPPEDKHWSSPDAFWVEVKSKLRDTIQRVRTSRSTRR